MYWAPNKAIAIRLQLFCLIVAGAAPRLCLTVCVAVRNVIQSSCSSMLSGRFHFTVSDYTQSR